MRLEFEVPLKAVSAGNERGCWQKRHARTKTEAKISLAVPRWKVKPTTLITFTRVGPELLDSHDNLRASLKRVVDAVTRKLGFADDSSPLLAFEYAQEKGTEYAVRVCIEGTAFVKGGCWSVEAVSR